VPCGHEGEESNLLPSLREQSRRWREANLEKARAREAAYRAANREARRAYMAAYKASQKDAARLHAREATFVQTLEGPGARFSRSCPRAGGSSPHRAPDEWSPGVWYED
jgi:hypothetical protein